MKMTFARGLIELTDMAPETGFLESLWAKTKYFRKKPGFFGWVRKSRILVGWASVTPLSRQCSNHLEGGVM